MLKKYLLFTLSIFLTTTCWHEYRLKPEITTIAKPYQTGYATWYGPGFNGKLTATGEIYDMYAYTAAHRTLKLNSIVLVRNVKNGLWTVVRINDRGPVKKTLIIDLSKMAAIQLGITQSGSGKVQLYILSCSSNPLGKIIETYANLGNKLKNN